MNRPPDCSLSGNTFLVRRAPPRAIESRTRAVKALSFNLRPASGEASVSLYVSSEIAMGDILSGAPGPGWGLVGIKVEDLRSHGFTVERAEAGADPLVGHAHVLATPPAYDEDGQIPLHLREALAAKSVWVREPARR